MGRENTEFEWIVDPSTFQVGIWWWRNHFLETRCLDLLRVGTLKATCTKVNNRTMRIRVKLKIQDQQEVLCCWPELSFRRKFLTLCENQNVRLVVSRAN